MNNPEKLAAQCMQEGRKKQHTTQCVLDNTMPKQTQIT